jgi:hypothetical protein
MQLRRKSLLKKFGSALEKERPRPDVTLNEVHDLWLNHAFPDFTEIGDIKVTALVSAQDMGDDLVIGSLGPCQLEQICLNLGSMNSHKEDSYSPPKAAILFTLMNLKWS